jgi:hypothetical protein
MMLFCQFLFELSDVVEIHVKIPDDELWLMLQKRVFVDMHLCIEYELNNLYLIWKLVSRRGVHMMNTNDEEVLLKVTVVDHELESKQMELVLE